MNIPRPARFARRDVAQELFSNWEQASQADELWGLRRGLTWLLAPDINCSEAIETVHERTKDVSRNPTEVDARRTALYLLGLAAREAPMVLDRGFARLVAHVALQVQIDFSATVSIAAGKASREGESMDEQLAFLPFFTPSFEEPISRSRERIQVARPSLAGDMMIYGAAALVLENAELEWARHLGVDMATRVGAITINNPSGSGETLMLMGLKAICSEEDRIPLAATPEPFKDELYDRIIAGRRE